MKILKYISMVMLVLSCTFVLVSSAHGESSIPDSLLRPPPMDRFGDHQDPYSHVPVPAPGHPSRTDTVTPAPNMQLRDPDSGGSSGSSSSPWTFGLVPCGDKDTPCTIQHFIELGANLFNYLMTLVGILAIGALVFAGFLYMTASGDEQQISRAKQVATYAIIGLVVALFSVVLVRFVLDALEYSGDDPLGN